ncbi:hypothetical protein [Pyrobaculum aerophilum]|uniref:hypothetical protein n=1 Tax=Pyrobaculum aerophilum TaxID=13773 RepID=UPI002FD8F779
MSIYYLDRFYKAPCIAVTVDCAVRAASQLAPRCKPVRVCVWPGDAPEVIEVFCEGGPSLKLMREASPSLLAEYYAGEKDCFQL